MALKMDDETWTIATKDTECEVFDYLFGRGQWKEFLSLCEITTM